MAEHGDVQFATAEGNDYREHEGTYALFLKITVVGILLVASILLALTLGGVHGHWLLAAAIIVVAIVTAVIGLATGKNTPSIVVFVLSLLALPLTA